MHCIVFMTPNAPIKRGVLLIGCEEMALEAANRLLMLPEVEDLAVWAPQDENNIPNGEMWSYEDWRSLQDQPAAREYGRIMLARAYGAE